MKILAIDIGGTTIKVCVSNERGQIKLLKEYKSEARKGGKHLVDRLIVLIKQDMGKFDAIGISTAGQVNSEEGFILYANENIPDYTGIHLKGIFEQAFSVPVKVENDVNAAALGEMHFGTHEKFKDFLYLTYGTGVGGAIIKDSKIYRGCNGIAAEFGHMITHKSRKTDSYHETYYEKYASTNALVKRAKLINERYINGHEIFKGLRDGDVRLDNIINEWIEDIVSGLASLIHIFNPPVIILGGGIMEQQQLVTMIRNKVMNSIMESYLNVHILQASLGNNAGILGAVSLHLNK